MKKLVFALSIAAFAPIASADSDRATALEQAKNASADFAVTLKSELMAAMQSGGPVEAIEVCNTKAPVIAENISLETGMTLTRVSLKNRNPDNAPNEWQTDVLNSFENRNNAGEAPGSLTWQDVADTDSGKQFRFMKAIPTAALCLQCHGETLAPAVSEKLAELYPEDKATGFHQGDLRGAFVVTRPLN